MKWHHECQKFDPPVQENRGSYPYKNISTLNLSARFALYYRKLPNLNRFDYRSNPKVIQYADKVAVRDYVREHGSGYIQKEGGNRK